MEALKADKSKLKSLTYAWNTRLVQWLKEDLHVVDVRCVDGKWNFLF